MSDSTNLDDFPVLMSVRQVAEVFGVTSQTVQNWCKSGRFPGTIRPGGKQWRIPKQSVLALINEEFG